MDGLLHSPDHRAVTAILHRGIDAVHGDDAWARREQLTAEVRAAWVADHVVNAISSDGFPAAFTDVDASADELVWAAERVGATAHAAALAHAAAAFPPEVRADAAARSDHLVDHGELILAEAEAVHHGLEDQGDILLEHVIRFVLAHPEAFAPYR